jgi:hypothetical protein
MVKKVIFSVSVVFILLSLTSWAQTPYRGDSEETEARIARPDSQAEGEYCPPCLEKKNPTSTLNSNTRNRPQVVNGALGTDDSSRKGEGTTQ